MFCHRIIEIIFICVKCLVFSDYTIIEIELSGIYFDISAREKRKKLCDLKRKRRKKKTKEISISCEVKLIN